MAFCLEHHFCLPVPTLHASHKAPALTSLVWAIGGVRHCRCGRCRRVAGREPRRGLQASPGMHQPHTAPLR